MLWLAMVFLLIALLAAYFGHQGIAGLSADMAKILFVICIILFVISLLFGWVWPVGPRYYP